MKEKVVKKLATATLVSGAMLLAANKQSTVQAAGLNVKDNSNEAQSEEQKAQQPEVTKDQAQADVNKAQSERDEAKSQVNEAQKNADNANKEVANAQSQVEQATKANDAAQELQKQATPEHINDVKANITSQNEVIANHTDAVKQAQNDVNQKQDARSNAQQQLDSAKEAEAKRQAEADQAKKVLDEAQANANATKAEINKAAQNVTDAENKVTDTQKAIQNETANKNKLATDVKNAETAIDQASKDADAKDAALTQARQKSNAAKTELDEAQGKVNDLQAKVNSINTIIMPKGYLMYNQWGAPDRINAAAAAQGYELNSYKNDPEAEKETVAHNADGVIQLTDAQQLELNLWVAGILNNVRDQLGFKTHLAITPMSLAYTNYIATHSTVPTFDHDDKAIDGAGDLIPGVRVETESIGTAFYAENMNDVKKGTWAHMLSMLFDDAASGWGHAQDLNGQAYEGDRYQYFGVSLRKDKGFIQFDSFASDDPEQVEKGMYTIPNSDGLKAQLAAAKTELASKQSVYDTANAATQSAAQVYNVAARKLSDANQAYTSAKDAYDSADINLAKLNQSLSNLNSTLENAKNTYASLTASTSEKQKKVSEATNNYNSAQTKVNEAKENTTKAQKLVDKAQSELDHAKAQLSKAQANLEQSQDKLSSLEKELTDLQNADANATKTSQELAAATTKLNNAKDLSDSMNEKLAEAKSTLAERKTALTNAKTVLAKIEKEEAAKAAVKKAQEAAAKTAKEKAEHTNFYKAGDKLIDDKGQVVPSGYTVLSGKVYDENGSFIGVVTDKVQSRVVAHAISRIEAKETSISKTVYVPKHAKVKSSSVLPTTGSSSDSIIGALGLAIASMGSILGLASSKKKEER